VGQLRASKDGWRRAKRSSKLECNSRGDRGFIAGKAARGAILDRAGHPRGGKRRDVVTISLWA
jgi:hypothetical protein